MSDEAIRQSIASAKRIVVKIGTSAICDESGRLDCGAVNKLARQIAQAMKSGISITLVASGAIGAGLGELDLPSRPKTVPMLQAVAAAGQGQLMRTFHDVFARHSVKVAQVLVTRDAFEDRTRYLNIRNTLLALGELGALAIINENDAVCVDEIRYGDNDIIAAHVTNMLAAELLVLLTVVDGVIENGKVLDLIDHINNDTLALATGEKSALGSGGMASKLTAAKLVTGAGELAVIANAHEPKVLTRILDGERVGTALAAAKRRMSSRRRWIAQASRPGGKLYVDDGAATALRRRGKSLLPSGIVAVVGKFAKGATVSVIDSKGVEIARGLTNYSAAQVEQIKGLKTTQIRRTLGDKPYDAVVHRNNMTLT